MMLPLRSSKHFFTSVGIFKPITALKYTNKAVIKYIVSLDLPAVKNVKLRLIFGHSLGILVILCQV